MLLSEILKSTRTVLFLSQEDFATRLCVSVATINRWEKGKSKPNLAAMKKLKAFCNSNNLNFSEIEKEWRIHSSKE